MSAREMITKLRVNQPIELRVNNCRVLRVDKDDIGVIKGELLGKEVYDWGLDNSAGKLYVFINVKE